MPRLLTFFLVLLVVALQSASARSSNDRPLSQVLDERIEAGQRIIYSSDLVREDMLVDAQPSGGSELERLRDLLSTFGLDVRIGVSGEWLVVAGEAPESAEASASAARPAAIPEIVVSASLHRLRHAEPVTHTRLDRELATRIPTLAEEAVRLTDRLPGTANGGVSSQNHVRGGETNEVLFLLDGLRLYEPYHLKQFQAIATIVNPAAIDSIDFYSGAYPARFGDRMSGVLTMDLHAPEKRTETELSLSFFNASAMSAGHFGADGRGEWLVSGRRGNLDVIVDLIEPDYGSPDYHDLLSHIGWDFGPRAAISANLLFSKDKLSLSDPDRGEFASAAYKNEVFWLKWQADWSDAWQSETIAAYSDISNRRSGRLELPGIVSGTLAEDNSFRVLEVRQDWQWHASEDRMMRFGANLKRLDADYRFSSQQFVSAPFDSILDNQAVTERAFLRDPAGAQYAAYGELRWRLISPLVLELGLRWDQQTYTTASDDRQLSPRVAVLYELGERSLLRLGWGQYYQAQEINELQLSDGLDTFFPAQRAEHFVVNVEHRLGREIDLALTAYRKRFRNVRPNFENAFNTLTLLPEIQFDRQRIDASSAEAIGVEATVASGTDSDNLFWWLGYSWARIEDRVSGSDVPRSWDQMHTVKAGLSWRWTRWDFSMAGEWHTGWPKTELHEVPVPGQDGDELELVVTPRNAERYANFWSLDARVSRDVEVRYGQVTVFLEVSNLANRKNPCCTEYSLGGEGRLLAKQANWLPLVPSLGVVWSF